MKKVVCFYSVLVLTTAALGGKDAQVTSPNKQITLTVTVSDTIEYGVTAYGKTVLESSAMGLAFAGQKPLGQNVEIASVQHSTVNQSWKPAWGTESMITDKYNQIQIDLCETTAPKRFFSIIVRVYDDGIAYRYDLPEQAALQDFVLTSDDSCFTIPEDATFWAADFGGYYSNQETTYDKRDWEQMLNGRIYGLPVTVKLGDEVYAAITEAHIEDWAGMYLAADNADPFAEMKKGPQKAERLAGAKTLKATLSPIPKTKQLVKSVTPCQTPWRVVMIGRTPGDLIESNLIVNLNPPCQLADTSWIKPGTMAWDHWWSGDVKMNTATIKEYIQFAADMDFPYMLIDWQWYGPFNRPTADVTTVNPAVDMDEVRRFARKKGVDLWLWLYWSDIDRQLDEAFALYESWGIKGVKIDFMQRDDQWMINWYRKVIVKAAEHKLMVNLHGAYKPDGIRRTLPNLLTREGVLGNEVNRGGKRITADHNCTLPFTRMLVGPMDYTPGGFINRTPATFKNARPTQVQTTRCQQLAMLVVYESPLLCVCDHPDNYVGQPGLEFMKAVPTDWDATKVLNGEIGEFVSIARKSGDKWYLGAMTNKQGRTLNVPLDFLGSGTFKAHIFADGPDAAQNAEQVSISTRTVKSADTLTVKMAPSGGYAAWFEPVN